MIRPKRYDVGMKEQRCDRTGFCASFPWVYQSDDGKYVLQEDYAALQAENEWLKGEERVNELGTLAPARLVRYWMEKCKQNEDENQRLRKAGDAMFNLIGCGFYEPNSELENLMKAWLAAKGVQP